MTFPNGYGVKPIGLTVGLPVSGRKVAVEWAINYENLNVPVMVNRCTQITFNRPIAEARNMICKGALERNNKYVFFLDDDVTCPSNTLRRLLYDLEQDDDVGIACGIYCSKEDLPQPLVFKEIGNGAYWKWKAGETFEVAAAATGCMMIRTDILKDIPEPWFMSIDMDQPPDTYSTWRMTDDIYFCHKVKEHTKYKIVADGNILCIHYDYATDPPKPFYLPVDSYPMKDTNINFNGNIVQVNECQSPPQN